MNLSTDLDIFFNTSHFAVSCTAGSTTGKGILEQPTEVIADGVVLTTDYMLTAKASDFGNLAYGSGITVDGSLYSVRSSQLVDDGLICKLFLTKATSRDISQVQGYLEGGGPTTTEFDETFDGGSPE
jgi:hypothetical protein